MVIITCQISETKVNQLLTQSTVVKEELHRRLKASTRKRRYLPLGLNRNKTFVPGVRDLTKNGTVEEGLVDIAL